MKSRCNKCGLAPLALGCVLLGFGVGPQAVAGVVPAESQMELLQEVYQDETLSEKQRPPGDRDLPTAQPSSHQQDRNASSVLRCWQKGHLIFEEKNWRPGKSGPLPGPVLRSTDGRFDTLRLSDFGETFCYMKSREGGE